jgi:hypothetical protein
VDWLLVENKVGVVDRALRRTIDVRAEREKVVPTSVRSAAQRENTGGCTGVRKVSKVGTRIHFIKKFTKGGRANTTENFSVGRRLPYILMVTAIY